MMTSAARILLLLVLATVLSAGVSEPSKKLKVFILAGQSNMESHAKLETFDYIGDEPATAPLLGTMRGSDGKPTVWEGAWISYLTGAGENNFEITGQLAAGYGSMWGLDFQPGYNGQERSREVG
jgi:hypothetical protein